MNSENKNKNKIYSMTTTDMHVDDLANPEKLNNDIKYYDKNTYLNNKGNDDYDDDDEYNGVDDNVNNYSHKSNNSNRNNNNSDDDSENDEEDDNDSTDNNDKTESSKIRFVKKIR